MTIELVTEGDLGEVLPLMRAYCDFYEVEPGDDALLALARALIADPDHEGMQLLARDDSERAVGFATIFWSWSTLSAARLGTMNDLFVDPAARGSGVGAGLIQACAERCREHGATRLEWSTALDNKRAQSVYDATGAERSQWLDYSLPVSGASSPR